MTNATLTTGQIISLGDGRLACDISEVYTAVDLLLDENISTVGLLSAGKYLKPRIQAEFPWVKELPDLNINDNMSSEHRALVVKKWVKSISEQVGEAHEVPDMSDKWVKRNILDDIVYFMERR